MHKPYGAYETFEHWERHHHRFYHQGRGYAFGRHEDGADYPEQSAPGALAPVYERHTGVPSRMSINTTQARDVWHGYRVACPDRDDDR